MKYEKTQKGNPHQLTIRQHCFPKRSIERFCNENGVVNVRLIKEKKTVSLKPDHSIFCAHRVWNQRAESLFMQKIERAYQEFVSQLVIDAATRRLNTQENQTVTDMYSLWHVRCCWRRVRLGDQELVGILAPTDDYSSNDKELLEKHNLSTCKTDGASVSIPGRHIAGILIQNDWGRVRRALRGFSWAIVESKFGEFIVPDNAGIRSAMPVTPTIYLTKGTGYHKVSGSELREINALLKAGSEQYYFGRQL